MLRWGVLSQRGSWPLSAASPLQTWWQYLRMPADSRAAPAAATPLQPGVDALALATQGPRADVLLISGTVACSISSSVDPPGSALALPDGQVATEEPAQEAAALDAPLFSAAAGSVGLSGPSQVLLPAPAQCLPEQLDGSGVEACDGATLLESGLVLPVRAQALPGAAAAEAESLTSINDGAGASRTGQLGGEAIRSSAEGRACTARERRAESSSAARLDSTDILPDSSFFECAAGEGWSRPKPITVRDIVSEWALCGHEVVTVRR